MVVSYIMIFLKERMNAMKKAFKKLMAACCATSMLMTMPGMTVLAAETELADQVVEEAVGADGTNVGNGVKAVFNEDTGAVVLTSQNGELWSDWVDELGADRDEIISIEVESGTVYLPADAEGRDEDENYQMFAGLTNLTSLDLGGFDTSYVMNMNRMFEDCSSLTELDFGSFETSNVENMAYMFAGCNSLEKLDLGSFDTSGVTDMESMFTGCASLEQLDLSSFDTENAEYMESMFDGCSSLISLDLGSFNTPNVTSMYRMFAECESLTELVLDRFDTSNVTDMDSMFIDCMSLPKLDLGSFDTSNVESMYSMFSGCSELAELKIDSFDTSSVTDMSGMFAGCGSLTELSTGSFDTANVTDMNSMFSGCENLSSLDLGSFDTSGVTDMSGMFYSCSSLEELDLGSFDTSNVTDMYGMFAGCAALRKLNLSSFDTTTVEDTSDMLSECSNLILLETPDVNTQAIELPVELYDEAGTSYTEIPELSESITLFIAIDITDCDTVIDPETYTYDGSAKEPAVTVNYDGYSLEAGGDYQVTYEENVNAGTAAVKITGIGHNTGEQSLSFTINKAEPQLSFAEATISKKTTDAAFTNALTKTTDGTVTFTSSDTKVADVDSANGKVTLKGAGSAIITAKASEGSNYKAGSASYTVKVEAPTPAVSGFSDVQNPSHPYYKAIYWAAAKGITGGYKDGTFGIDKPCTRGHAVMFLWRMAGSPAPKAVSGTPFPDVPNTHPYYKAVLWAQQNAITTGYTTGANKGKFGIDDTCTRGQIMRFIWNFKKKPAPKNVANSPFSDVPTSHAFYKAILWGSQNGITKGYTTGPDKGKFGINDNCTRGQIVKFLYNIK